jgi:hypothetical protein
MDEIVFLNTEQTKKTEYTKIDPLHFRMFRFSIYSVLKMVLAGIFRYFRRVLAKENAVG